MTSSEYQLQPEKFGVLAEALGEIPETVISIHLLNRRLCRAYVAGDIKSPIAAVIHALGQISEPHAFGNDPESIWKLLKEIDDWDCVNVSNDCAAALGQLVLKQMGRNVRYCLDVHHVLTQPAAVIENDAIRKLTTGDCEVVEATQFDLSLAFFESTFAMLEEGFVAGGFVEGALVSIAWTSALTENYADIGVNTLEPYRCRGLATAAASNVARRVQEAGKTAVWSCAEHNVASLRVAQKICFKEVCRRTYIILEEDKQN